MGILIKNVLAIVPKDGSDAVERHDIYIDGKTIAALDAAPAGFVAETTIDGTGQAGLEQSLDRYLSGKAGHVLSQVDGKGRTLGYGETEYVAAVNGGSVTLTIDASIQSFAEQAAREALEVNNAKAVRVLAMDPATGEILAMVNKPDYDLNDPPRDDVRTLTDRMRNRVLTDAYEPGSTALSPSPRRCRTPATPCSWRWAFDWARTSCISIWMPSASGIRPGWTSPAKPTAS